MDSPDALPAGHQAVCEVPPLIRSVTPIFDRRKQDGRTYTCVYVRVRA
jgi:hypothetical protein